MGWKQDYAILHSYQDIHRLDLGLIQIVVDRAQNGSYFFKIIGAKTIKSEVTFVDAQEAKVVAESTVRNYIGRMLRRLVL